MNTLKPLLIIAIVGGIGYGAWSRLNRKPDANVPGWDATPTVQFGDNGGAWSPAGASTAPNSSPPTFSGLAPAATTPPTAAPTATNEAPIDSGASAPAAPPFGAGSQPAESPPAATAASPNAMASAAPSGYPATDAGAYGSAAAAAPDPASASAAFAPVLETARRELDAGRLAEGLLQLSGWYDNPQLSAGEQQQLNDLLNQVSGSVIYSTRSFSEPPYEVQPGERLEDIAARYSVSPQLIAKINGIDDPQSLRPGERLKVVRGPFEASISLDKRVLTLWVGGAYAGRFALGIGRDFPPREGQFVIENKVVNPDYHGPERTIGGGDPSNPLGSRWLGMPGGYGIHGTNDPAALGSPEQGGCMALGPRDLEDVFDILTIGSRVTIHR